MISKFWKNGELYVWTTAAAVAVTFSILLLLIFVILRNGLGHFWPTELVHVEMKDGKRWLGEITGRDRAPDGGWRIQLKVGNRDLYGQDFLWVLERDITTKTTPAEAVMMERVASGNFYGHLKHLALPGLGQPDALADWGTFKSSIEKVQDEHDDLENRRDELADLSYELEGLREEIQSLNYDDTPEALKEAAQIQVVMDKLKVKFQERNGELLKKTNAIRTNSAVFVDAAGTEKNIALIDIVRTYQPNTMGGLAKTGVYLSKFWELLSGEPREANTEGGLFPAIFGTVLMVMIMSFFSIPMGVVAAIYLREYAKDGWMVRMVRIAVYNLAGVPSIVYGVFGMGFFVYGVGGSIDQFFFADRLPTPTFGTGGILWASLTLSLLTVPVVIVATEESFASVPKGIREGSLSLGATQFQTLVRVLLPMATPGIMTGFILAMARAAGEVAPLMITGVVKLAPAMPLDGQFPFLHLDRKFMHLGFHIFDVGFQSPNVEAAKPMVYITTMLLIMIVLVMSLAAIYLRNRMRKRFQTATF